MEILLNVIHWGFGALSLLSAIAVVLSFPGIIVAAIVEALRQAEDERTFRYTERFAVLFGLSLLVMIVVLILWQIAVSIINALI